jgi:hypothetical protein
MRPFSSRRDIDPTRLEGQTVTGQFRRQRARPIEDTTERPVRIGGGMDDHEQRGGKIGRKLPQQALQGFQRAR